VAEARYLSERHRGLLFLYPFVGEAVRRRIPRCARDDNIARDDGIAQDDNSRPLGSLERRA